MDARRRPNEHQQHHTQRHHQHQHKQQHHVHNITNLQSFHHQVIRPLTEVRGPYIKSDTLKKLHVSQVSLSFTAGQLPRGVDSFFEPIDPSVIGQWLEGSKPWTFKGKDLSCPNLDDDIIPQSGQVEARFFWEKIEDYLTRTDDRNASCPILDRTNWRQQDNRIKALNCLSKGEANWQVQVLQSWSLGCEGDQRDLDDVAKPHVICFLTDDAPPREDAILTSELTTISILAYLTAIQSDYSKHSLIPITVVTASARDVRIIQGIVDVQKSRLQLRVSEIVNFNKGIIASWNQFLTLLGWMVSKPIGTTVQNANRNPLSDNSHD